MKPTPISVAAPVADSSPAELLRLILGPPSSALPDPYRFANDLLADFPGRRNRLSALVDLTPEYLARLRLPATEATRLLATAEIVRQLAREPVPFYEVLDTPDLMARHLFPLFHHVPQNVLGVLLLDGNSRWITHLELARGFSSPKVLEASDIASVFDEALRHNATGLVLFRYDTLSSGAPSPRPYDQDLAGRFYRNGLYIGLNLVDLVTLGRDRRWTSLRTIAPDRLVPPLTPPNRGASGA